MSSTTTGFALEGRTVTPIAQLGPDLPEPSNRAISGLVTLVWPYNSTSKTLAFILAERDSRLRRKKGQVRVQLRGSSAAAISALKLGGGDTVTLGLEGVEWVKDDTVPFPSSRIEWQIEFADKLVLQATVGAKQEIKRVTVDHRHLIPTPPLTDPDARPVATDPVPAATPSAVKTAPVITLADSEPNEYASPAFLKRARLSYGALFEGDLELFDDDGGAKGKGRKRTKFGRASNEWRYTSQSPSPSPEPEQPGTPSKTAEAAVEVNMEEQTSPARPPMTDEGCQTMDVDMSEAPANQPVPQEPVARGPEEAQRAQSQQEQPPSPKKAAEALSQQQHPAAAEQSKEPSPPSKERSNIHAQTENSAGLTLPPIPKLTSEQSSSPDPRYKEVLPSPLKTADELASPPGPSVTDQEVAHPTSKPDKQGSPRGSEPIIGHASTSVLFSNSAPSQSGYDAPRFGKPIPSAADGGFGIADQVRFGFSHVPQAAQEKEQTKQQETALGGDSKSETPREGDSKSDTKPEPAKSNVSGLAPPLLEPSGPDKYYDMDSYIGPAEQEMEQESNNPFAMATAPPAVETFGEGAQWAMATEDPSYNSVEGGHYGIDALEEGTRITSNEAKIRSDEIDVDKVPPGFSSYGKGNEGEIASEPEDSEDEVDQSFVPGEDFVQNEDLEDDLDDEVALEDNDHREYNSEGDVLESGDYDQRPYNEPESDSDGIEDEKFMVEDEVFARDNHPDMIDEDEMRNDVVDDTGAPVAGDYGDTVGPEGDDISEDDDGDMGDDEIMEEYDEDDEAEQDEEDDGEEQGSYDEEEEGSYDEDEDEEANGRSEGFYDHNANWQDRGRARMRSPPVPQASRKPEVISLLSDSEEESDDDDEGPLEADSASPQLDDSAQSSQRSQDAVKQDLEIHDGDIDPVLLQAVASDQDAAQEEAATKKVAEQAEEEELEKAFEEAQSAEDDGAAAAKTDIDNQASTTGGDADESGIDERAAVSFDGAGSSPAKKASAHDESEKGVVANTDASDHAVADQDKEEPTSAAPATSEEQQVSSPMRSNPVTDDQEPVADIVSAVAQSTDLTTERETSAEEVTQAPSVEAPLDHVPAGEEVGLVRTDVAVAPSEQADVPQVAPVAAMEVDEPVPQHDTPGDTQDDEGFMSQPEDVMDTRSQTSAEVEDDDVQESVMDRDEPEPPSDVDMEDAAGEVEPSDMSMDGHGEEDDHDEDETMDVDAELETQLRIEMTQTTVIQEVVMERSVSAQAEANVMDGEASYYSASQDMDLGLGDRQSDEESIEGDVTGQDIQEAILPDDGEMTGSDMEKDDEEGVEEAVMVEEQEDGEDHQDDVDLVGGEEQSKHDDIPAKSATEVVVEIPARSHDEDAGHKASENLDTEVGETPETNIEIAVRSSPAPDAIGAENADDADVAEEGVEDSNLVPETAPAKAKVSRPTTRSQKAKQQHDDGQRAVTPVKEVAEEEALQTSPKTAKQPSKASSSKRSKPSHSKPKEVVDPSIELARASLKKRARTGINKSIEDAPSESETKEGHWIHTRQHSPPGRCSLSPEVDAIIKEDSSVALARAALRSPSKRSLTSFASAPDSPPKDLTKRLRTTLSEYTPLKTVRTSKNRPDYFHVLAIAVSSNGPPQRTKSREYVMSISVTDPSIAPNHAVEVHLIAGHKAYLPADIQPGQGVMLKKFEGTGKAQQYALQATKDSSWAVFENDEDMPDVKPGSDEEGVDDVVVQYMRDLRAWYGGLDEGSVEKLVKAAGELKASV